MKVRGCLYGCIFHENTCIGGCGRTEKTKIGAILTGAGDAGTGAAGPTGTGMLEDASRCDCVELVQSKSKSYIDTLLVVLFNG